jgi:hypothetical protein
MLILICTVGAAALAVAAYTNLRQRSPEAATAGLRAVRELSAVILVGAKASRVSSTYLLATSGCLPSRRPRAGAIGTTASSMRTNDDG